MMRHVILIQIRKQKVYDGKSLQCASIEIKDSVNVLANIHFYNIAPFESMVLLLDKFLGIWYDIWVIIPICWL